MNSWGKKWGEQGYMRILREADDHVEENKCGIDTKPQDGTGCTGGPKQVITCGNCGILHDSVRPYFSGGTDPGGIATEWQSVQEHPPPTELVSGQRVDW